MRPGRPRRFPNAALWAAFLFVSATPTWAAEALDLAVRVLKEVCADPMDVAQSLGVAKARAAKDGWRLVFEGPVPAPIMHGENGPKISDMGSWHIPLEKGGHLSLFVSAVNAERKYRELPLSPPFRWDACLIGLPDAASEDEIGRVIGSHFGLSLEKEVPSRYVTPRWHFVEAKARGDCGRSISALGNGSPPRFGTLILMDVGPLTEGKGGPFECPGVERQHK